MILEISNNLTKRYSVDKGQTLPAGAYKLAEGRLGVEGRFKTN